LAGRKKSFSPDRKEKRAVDCTGKKTIRKHQGGGTKKIPAKTKSHNGVLTEETILMPSAGRQIHPTGVVNFTKAGQPSPPAPQRFATRPKRALKNPKSVALNYKLMLFPAIPRWRGGKESAGK